MQYKILILSDSKPGHQNQCIGIAEAAPSASYKVVQVNYRFGLGYLIALILCNLRVFSQTFLNLLLDSDTLKEIENERFDIILSAGSSVAPLNLLIGKTFKIPSVYCMIHRLLPASLFDLIFTPLHDNPPDLNNIIKTLGAPNRINESFLSGQKDLSDFSRNEKPVISLLLGGETKNFSMGENWVKMAVKSIKETVESIKGTVLITTSRRTPDAVEKVIELEFKDYPFTGYLLLASKSNENPTPSFFLLSDVVVVTEDSISMVSEAASSGKKVIVLKMERKSGRSPKHTKTIVEMEKGGYIKISSPEIIAEDIVSVLNDNFFPVKVLGEAKRCAAQIEKLLKYNKMV